MLIPISILLYVYWIEDDLKLSLVLIIIGVILLITILFYQLTIKIEDKIIHIIFGIGLVRFKIKPDTITTTEIIKYPWYYGYGIRFTPKGSWLYNISGTQAVFIHYKKNGMQKKVLLGSNDCENLKDFLDNHF